MLDNLTDIELELRLSTLERMIAQHRDTQTLAVLNRCFQQLIDEQVRRDLKAKEASWA